MVVGEKRFGVVLSVIVGIFVGLHFVRSMKQIFGYTVLHYI
jgi:hypothetical protein